MGTDEKFTPMQELVLELLVARIRSGETHWTFPRSARHTLSQLSAQGWVTWKDGSAGLPIAWLTDKGRAEFLSNKYIVPIALVDKPKKAAKRIYKDARALKKRISNTD